MEYEAFLEEKKRIRTLPPEEQKAFYAKLLETEKGKTRVRLQAYFGYALQFYYEGNFRRAREILEPFIVDYQAYGLVPEAISCFNLLGVLAHCESEYILSRYFYGKGLKNAQLSGEKKGFSSEYNNLALTYMAEKNYQRALYMILLSEKYMPFSDDDMGAYIYLNMAVIYYGLDQIEEAEKAFKKCTEEYRGFEVLPEDTKIFGIGLSHKLGDRKKYEAYCKEILENRAKLHAAELMDVCETIFDCAKADGDSRRMENVLTAMEQYMAEHQEEVPLLIRVEEFKYQYAEWKGDSHGMIQALKNKERFYQGIIQTTQKQHIKSLRRYADMNNQLQKAIENEMQANHAKTRFLANMSHDIRTPMNAIVGMTNLMEHAVNEPEKMRGYLKKVQLSSRHMMGLINDLLDMNRIESGATHLNMEPMNLAVQIEQMDDIIRAQTDEKGQTFEIRVHGVRHENLIGDAVRFRQVILNALTNAVKYTQSGGNIALDIEERACDAPEKATFCFTVTDNGMGMEKELIDHVFEPFARGEDSVVNKIQGTGLGMAIAKSLVDLMGGEIRIQSKPKEGTKIETVVSFAIDPNAEMEPIHLLLLSDDDELTQNLLEAAQANPLTLFCPSGEKIVETLKTQKIDVVLLAGQPYRAFSEEKAKQMRAAAGSQLLILGMDAGETEKNSGVDGEISAPFFLSKLEEEINRLRGNGTYAAGDSILNGLHFLCAEDNELNAEILTAMLEIAGASCEICPDGEKIVERFAKTKRGEFDAILMDVQMPNMNGYAATKAIRQTPLGQTIPIIAMTANAFSDDIQQSVDAGMDAHLSKPVDVALLEKTVRKLLENNK